MNWPGKPSAKPDEGAAKGPEKGSSPLPPQCPRCELTKTQFNRTIQNYQKAYRKKVEGLKTELQAVRNTNASLRKQVKRLKSVVRVHVPSVVVGVVAGALVRNYWPSIKKLFQRGKKEQAEEPTAAAQ
eukprot:CAMPEP_0202857276 /NCGR_PEP_ID=MMETSP1391-20130828/283_1 /ASSEMBLY_ACC=CAM_ASM_000867 /TAXON_ID=1034604 /ORGANISM="Chlamydomonas leiostraca, Strain SAG 11-49" /LENGTH=127 /DNA_ID=CAMNT_0049536061 /DNA_START=12 /DNA_END=395 /DNA_ORIENTATION=+